MEHGILSSGDWTKIETENKKVNDVYSSLKT